MSLLLILAVYGALLPVWFRVREPYARTAAWTASRVAFPLAGIHGSVTSAVQNWVVLTYLLPDPRTGGRGRIRQRFLDFSDIPLAIALAAGIPVTFRRRLAIAGISVSAVFVTHLALITWSASRLSQVLVQGATGTNIEDQVFQAADQGTRFGNVSTAVVLLFTALSIVIVGGLDLRPGGRLVASSDDGGSSRTSPADPAVPGAGGQ